MNYAFRAQWRFVRCKQWNGNKIFTKLIMLPCASAHNEGEEEEAENCKKKQRISSQFTHCPNVFMTPIIGNVCSSFVGVVIVAAIFDRFSTPTQLPLFPSETCEGNLAHSTTLYLSIYATTCVCNLLHRHLTLSARRRATRPPSFVVLLSYGNACVLQPKSNSSQIRY